MRNIINKQLYKYKNENVALLFSGGMDSLSLLLSCLEIGIKPRLYSFRLQNVISDDIVASRKIAKLYNLELVEVEIEQDVDKLISDITYIIKKYKVKKKTQIQCIQPFLYLVKEINENTVLSGLCADDILGTTRKMQIEGRKSDNEFHQMRLDKHNDLKSSSYCYIKAIFEENNKNFIAPYKDNDDLVNFLLSKTFFQIHTPKIKQITYDNYKEIEKNNLYRRNSSLQKNSGIANWHNELLETELNINNWKSVIGIYNYIYNQIYEE